MRTIGSKELEENQLSRGEFVKVIGGEWGGILVMEGTDFFYGGRISAFRFVSECLG